MNLALLFLLLLICSVALNIAQILMIKEYEEKFGPLKKKGAKK